MDDNRILQSMRQMAWERAKAEINSIFCAMYGGEERYEKFSELYKEFVSTVEDNGYHE